MAAFRQLQKLLSSRPVMAFPTSDGEFHLYVDAAGGADANPPTEGGFGSALFQVQGDSKRLIAYASRRLLKHEKNYSAFLLEKAAAIVGIDHFSHLLRGRKFSLFTDHRPLTALSKIHTKTLNRLQQQFLDFDFEIKYVPGKDNTVADYLSREGWKEAANILDKADGLGVASLDTDRHRLLAAQRSDEQCKTFTSEAQSDDDTIAKKFKLVRFLLQDGILRAEVRQRKGFPLLAAIKTVIPSSIRPHVLKQAHDSKLAGHSGLFKTHERIVEEFWWPGLSADITEHIKRCEPCNRADAHSKAADVGLQPLPLLSGPNQRVHIDMFGPLKGADGASKYVLVITDAFTKIVRLAITPDKSASTVVEAIIDNWINIFAVPKTILSDQGKEFLNNLQAGLWKLLDVEHNTTTPYHPQCNAQAEVFNRTMGHYLRAMLIDIDKKAANWELLIGPLMLSHNTAVNKATRCTPFYAMFGYNPRLPLWPELQVLDEKDFPAVKADEKALLAAFLQRQRVARKIAADNNADYQDTYARPPASPITPFKAGEKVWITTPPPTGHNRKLMPKWEKAIIVAETAVGVFKVRRFVGRRRTKTINIVYIRHRDETGPPKEDEEEGEERIQATPEEGRNDNNDDDEVALSPAEIALVGRLSKDLESWLAQPHKWSRKKLHQLMLRNNEYNRARWLTALPVVAPPEEIVAPPPPAPAPPIHGRTRAGTPFRAAPAPDHTCDHIRPAHIYSQTQT
jgi:transposase InsO family protein